MTVWRAHPAWASWEEDQKALRELDRLHPRWSFYGQRKLLVEMRRAGVVINRKRLRRLMSEAGIAAVAPKRWKYKTNGRCTELLGRL